MDLMDSIPPTKRPRGRPRIYTSDNGRAEAAKNYVQRTKSSGAKRVYFWLPRTLRDAATETALLEGQTFGEFLSDAIAKEIGR